MQSLEARQHYSGTFDCMAKILRNEGILAFWRGATPRLARLMLSGGIVFTVVRPLPLTQYEQTMDLLDRTFGK